MSEATTQPVVTATDTPAQPGAEVQHDARTDSLEAALSEFDAAIKPSTATTQPDPKPAAASAGDDDVKKRVETLERALSDRSYKEQIAPVLKKVRGDVPAEVFNDDELDVWINHRAKSDQRLMNAWLNRDKNPQAWDRVVDGLGREFGKKFSKPIDERATADREAVTAFVRGASTKAPEGKAPDFSGMSNAEFREAHKKEYGYYPKV
jgi:hypothetical protein